MRVEGVFVALATPFTDEGAVDEAGYRTNIEYLIEQGVAGIVPCGTTGESATLSWDEHNRVVDIAVDAARGRVMVIAGAGSNNTRESIEAARHAREAGADGVLCITPYYNKPTQEGLYLHYAAIAGQVPIPIILYNVPGRTGVNLAAETVERLSHIDTIIGVKEASGDVGQVSEIHRLCGERLSILSGEDALTLPILSVGGRGVISVLANIEPRRLVAMVSSYLEGRSSEALQLHEELLPLFKALFMETNPIPVKTAMQHLGFAAGPLRLPLVAMSPDNKHKLLSVIETGNVRRMVVPDAR